MQSINFKAPVSCQMTITINANKEKVWSVLTEINNWNKWNPSITNSKLIGALERNASLE